MPNMELKKEPDAGAGRICADLQLRRGGIGIYIRDRSKRGQTVLKLQTQAVCQRLPGRNRYSGVPRQGSGGRHGGRLRGAEPVNQPAGGVRPGVPAGEPVRGQMRTRDQG